MNWNISRDAITNARVTNGDDVWTGGSDNPHTIDKTVLSGPIDGYVTYTIPSGAVLRFGDYTLFE